MTSSSEPSDRELVQAFLRTRSEAAFLRLYDRHTDGLYRFATRLSGGAGSIGNEAEELVQEAWMRALKGLSGFRFEAALKTWLCAIVFNLWREKRGRLRKEMGLKVIEGARSPDNAPPPSPVWPFLEAALSELPEGYRLVLLLHDVEGFTHEEIADRFGIAEGTSKSQLHRARRALRRALEGRGVIEHDG